MWGVDDAIIAAGLGGLLSAGGSIGGGLIAGGKKNVDTSGGSRNSGNVPYYYNASADPVLNATSIEALLGLGQANPALAGQASPMAMVLAAGQNLGYGNFSDALTYLIGGGSTATLTDNEHDRQQNLNAINASMKAAGFSSLEQLKAAQEKWKTDSAALEAKMAPLRDQILQGRMAAYGGISKIAQDFPTASLGDINALAAQYEAQIRSGIKQDVTDQTDAILQAANMNRGNPAATLGRLSQQELLSRQAAPTTALERALQMLQGRQNLGSTALTAYQSVLDPANTYALNVATLRTNAAQQAANLMAGQSSQNAALQAQLAQNAANAQGMGFAGAGNALATGLSNYQSNQLLQALINKPSSSTLGPGSDTSRYNNPYSQPLNLKDYGF